MADITTFTICLHTFDCRYTDTRYFMMRVKSVVIGETTRKKATKT